MDIQKIKELALANGFKLKEQASGNMDLNAYVYDFANAIEQAAKAQAVPEGLRKSQEKVKVYELHVGTLKQIHENEFNEKSESSYILGNLDGFFECLESDLGEMK